MYLLIKFIAHFGSKWIYFIRGLRGGGEMSQQLHVTVSSIQFLATWQLLRGRFIRPSAVHVDVKKWQATETRRNAIWWTVWNVISLYESEME